ncbi:MAG: hypothetical protein QMD09_05140 [Desulfatibacillaceae bacterium]|nr:hypothetical protein [Desulfatibacillaceae bacterium]
MWIKALWATLAAGTLALILLFGALVLLAARPDIAVPHINRLLDAGQGKGGIETLELGFFPPRIVAKNFNMEQRGWSLDLDHLSILPDIKAYFDKGPWLGRVEARGLYLTIRPAEKGTPSSPKTEPSWAGPLQWLFAMREADIIVESLSAPAGHGAFSLAAMHIQIQPQSEDSRLLDILGDIAYKGPQESSLEIFCHITGSFDRENKLDARMEISEGLLDFASYKAGLVAGANLSMSPEQVDIADLALIVQPGENPPGKAAWPGGTFELFGQGFMEIGSRQVSFTLKKLEAGSWLSAFGQLSGQLPDGLSGVIQGNVADTALVLDAARPLLPQSAGSLKLAGQIPFELRLNPSDSGQEALLWLWPENLELGFDGQKASISGRLEGAGPLAGPYGFNGLMEGTASISRGDWAVNDLVFSLPFEGDTTLVKLPEIRLETSQNSITHKGKAVPVGLLSILTTASAGRDELRLNQARISSSRLGAADISALLKGNDYSFTFVGIGWQAQEMAALAAFFTKMPVEDWILEGPLGVTGSWSNTSGVAIDVAMTGLSFSSPDGRGMGQDLAGSLTFSFGPTSKEPVDARLNINKGEGLWDTIYLDFGANPVRTSFAGKVQANSLQDGRWWIEIGKMGSLEIAGKAQKKGSSWDFDLDAKAKNLDIAPLFATFVRESIALKTPSMADLKISGQAGAQMKVKRQGSQVGILGAVELADGKLGFGSDAPLIKGLGLALPLKYTWGGASYLSDAPLSWGRLTAEAISLKTGAMENLNMAMALWENRLLVRDALDIPIYNAKLYIDGIEVKDALSSDFAASFNARLGPVDFSTIPAGSISLAGYAGGDLGRVTVNSQLASVEKGLEGRLFGGSLTLKNLAVARPLESGRTIVGQARVSKMDLYEFSTALGLGVVTGQVDVSADNLAIAHGQPVSFDLEMRSTTDVSRQRRVSLAAVDSISVLSSGAGVGSLGAGLLYGFFDEFPYKELGFSCTLVNDVFSVRGLITEDGVEYLVKKPFLRGINVINRQRENNIAFSDMLQRLKRVLGSKGEPENSGGTN